MNPVQASSYLFQIKYTEGGEKNLELARSYFAQAAKLNPNNMRAQFGLLLVSDSYGPVARKPVFGVSDKASFKPVSSATETS